MSLPMRLWGLVLLAVLAVPGEARAASAAGVVWDGGFDATPLGPLVPPTTDYLELLREGNGPAPVVQSRQTVTGSGRAARWDIPATAGTGSLARSQLRSGSYAVAGSWTTPADGNAPGADRWFGLSFRLDRFVHDPDQWFTLANWRSNAGSGPLELATGPNGWELVRTWGSMGIYPDSALGQTPLNMGPVTVHRWCRMVFHMKWSTTGANALTEGWRRDAGQPTWSYRGRRTSANAISTDALNRLRVGYYQSPNVKARRTLYVDEVRIGRSFAAVS